MKLFGDDPKDDLVIKFKALTIYGYYDGPTLFTASPVEDAVKIYLFRWETSGDEEDDLLDRRVYKADGFDITTKEDQVDWSEAVT